MRLLNYKSNSFSEEVGLSFFEMKNLGQVVALFGPNGSGKTRMLKSILNIFSNRFTKAYLAELESRRDRLYRELETQKNQITQFSRESRFKKQKESAMEAVRKTEKQIELNHLDIQFKQFCFGNGVIDFRIVQLDGLKPQVSSPSNLQTLSKARKALCEGDTHPLAQNTGDFLYVLCQAAFDQANPNADPEINGLLFSLFEEAQRIFENLLQMEFSFKQTSEGVQPILDGRPVNPGELSQGQGVILNFGIYLLQQLHRKELLNERGNSRNSSPSLKGAIVLVDEPEKHLHPHAVIELIKNLRNLVGEDGQIWIATHCTALLGQLNNDEIWVIEDGQVFPPNANQNHRAVESLLGAEENIENMREFFQTPFRFAANKFATDCIFSPGTAEYKSNDPQSKQILEAINRKGDIVILDVGSGVGRLIDAIKDDPRVTDYSSVKFVAVEPNKDLHEKLRQKGKCFGQFEIFENTVGVSMDWKFDVAVLCNVLHEIRPTKWQNEIAEIQKRLKPEGILVFVEDTELPIGEMPHELGYLVLNARDLKIMFGLDAEPQQVDSPDEKYKDRLLCALISQEVLANCTVSRVKAAIENLKNRMDSKIQALRTAHAISNLDGRDGRKYAHYSQMYVNADFALKEF